MIWPQRSSRCPGGMIRRSLDWSSTIQDKPEDLELRLFVDAGFASDKSTARSTSGGFLALSGPSSFFPLVWISKRQTSTSRSTTESEVVSLVHSLYQEGLPALLLWELLLARSVTLRVHEDNQATILVVKKGYSPQASPYDWNAWSKSVLPVWNLQRWLCPDRVHQHRWTGGRHIHQGIASTQMGSSTNPFRNPYWPSFRP